jgi:lauroyl/myristoyl acyltransferase
MGPRAAKVLGRVIDAASWCGARLPARVAHGAAVIGGLGEWAVRPALRRQLADNLSRPIGRPATSSQVRRAVRRELVNEGHRSADLLWAIGRPDELLASLEVAGAEHARSAAARGKGMVLAGTHTGGWEVVASAPARVVPVPTTVLVADNWLAWSMQHIRTTAGLRLAYRSNSALALVRILQRGEALLVLGDDAFGGATDVRTVDFCGVPARLPAGIATLSRLAQAPIVTFSVLPIGRRRWRIVIDPPIEPPARRDDEQRVMQAVADRWSAVITAQPDQWAARFDIAWQDEP